MEIIIKSDYSEISSDSAMIVANQIKAKPNTVLGLATGSTPLGLYKELIRLHLNEGLDFSNVVTFNLDEYSLHLSALHVFSFPQTVGCRLPSPQVFQALHWNLG